MRRMWIILLSSISVATATLVYWLLLHEYPFHELGSRPYHAISQLRPSTLQLRSSTQQLKPNIGASTSKAYMTINDSGRLGNLMYKSFALCGIAWSSGHTPVLYPSMSKKMSHVLNISFIATVQLNNKALHWKVFNEISPTKFDARIQDLDTTYNWSINGYLQSWRYFHQYGDFIRANFKFREELVRKAKLFFTKNGLSTKGEGRILNIGIHVRRGDVLSAMNIKYGYVDVPPSYFRRAMDYFRRKYSNMKLNFIVTSDDIQWCRTHVAGTDVYYSIGQSDEEDLVLLSRSHHMIISIGSLGRIIGWYVGGDVIYYADFPRPGSTFYNKTTMADIFLPKWIALK